MCNDEKTRANAAGALGNLVRNSNTLCQEIVEQGVLEALLHLVKQVDPETQTDSSIKIALFSLGNLAVHPICKQRLKSLNAEKFSNYLVNLIPNPDSLLHRYAQRLLQKLQG